MTELVLTDVSRTYPAAVPVRALRAARLTVSQGDFLAIEGPSGAGKSTLLNVLALLDRPTAGTYEVDGTPVQHLDDAHTAALRCRTFGFVFQSFHLLPRRTAMENVSLGLTYHAVDPDEARIRAGEALEFVGLADRADFPVDRLSGGEKQRVAIARAVCADNPVLLADEPTGNLDTENSHVVMDILEALNGQGVTIIVVTHDARVAARARRRVHVEDGQVREVTPGGGDATGPVSSAVVLATSRTDATAFAAEPVAQRTGRQWLSRVTGRTMFDDVATSLRRDRSRTARLICVVVVSVMLGLTTLGLAQTARYQVSAAFDTQRNHRVAVGSAAGNEDVTPGPTALVAATTPDALARVRAVPGVEDVMAVSSNNDIDATTGPDAPPTTVRLFGIDDVPASTSLLQVTGYPADSPPLGDGQVLVGTAAASTLGLGPVEASPTLWIEGEPYEVVGLVSAAGMRDELTGGVILGLSRAAEVRQPQSAGLEIWTQAGAAQQVAQVAAVAWTPELADATTTVAPPDPRSLRDSIEGSVRTILLTLSTVAVLAALASLSNATGTAVRAREGELALRRAIGARRVHLRMLVSAEAVVIGMLGGLLGALGSVVAVLVVTIVQRWQPVIDPWSLPLGIGAGVLAGLLGSVTSARRAGRIDPASALR